MADTHFRKAFLLFMVTFLTIGLLIVLRGFLMTILAAALLTGLLYPVFTWLTGEFGGRRKSAAGVTLFFTVLIMIGPLAGIISLVIGQAASIVDNVRPAIERAVSEPTYLDELLRKAPGYEYVEPYRQQILEGAGDVVNSIGRFLMTSLQNTTRGTASFLFHFIIALYTIFFLLLDGPGMLRETLNHLPLHRDEKERLIDRFVSVTRATIKGTIIIGVIQGVAAGVAFWIAGVPNAAFWTVVMIVMSILPLIGSALIWVPASIILFASGQVTTAILLALYCALIVGSIDNVLRPRLVGQDTKMHDLVILFSTLGGLAVFGPLGFVIGPVLAGLFVTSWEIFGQAYSAELVDGTPRIITPDGQDAGSVTEN
ncbi:MAG: AI-2E family transporter [Acidobacteria bacterium]|jgi:predicted PurR-regulated permease PerM|nr:AI-2E family transporter [Acidobacteriota bacterium]